MSLGDFHVLDPDNGSTPVAHKYHVILGTANSIKAGEWVIKDGSNANYVKVAADGASNTAVWVGVAASTSNDTTAADGTVEVYDNPDYVFRGKPTTATNLAYTIRFDQVTLDVTSSVQTIDENDTSNGTFIIQDFDTDKDTIDVKMAKTDHITAG